MLPIHVISLPGAILRRQKASAQLDAQDFEFCFFDAIDGQSLNLAKYPAVNQRLFQLNTGRNPSPGELGCFMSHRALWALARQSGKAMIILEDDFYIQSNFCQAVSMPLSTVEDLGIVRLQAENKPCKYPLFASQGCTFWRYTKVPFGACAYIVSPAAAGKLLQASECIEAPVDTFLKMPWKFNVPIHAMTPYPVGLSALSNQSQITDRQKSARTWQFQLNRFWYRCEYQARRFWFNLTYRVTSGSPAVLQGSGEPSDRWS